MGCKFSIGQRIVAIADHHAQHFLKDQEFTVLGIVRICDDYGIKITEDDTPSYVICRHGNSFDTKGIHYSQSFFAPIQETGGMTFEEALALVSPKKIKAKNNREWL